MDVSVFGMIFFETCHALRLGNYRTEVNLRMFQRGVFAQVSPVPLNYVSIEFGHFANRKADSSNANRIGSLHLLDRLIEHCFCRLLFTHRMDKLYDMRFVPGWQLDSG